jgi:hypothetical protein
MSSGPTLDRLPGLLQAWVAGNSDGKHLLDETRKQVGLAARPYPASYFPSQQKDEDAVEELALITFAHCDRVAKGRFPFLGRTPFVAFVEEQLEGPKCRYHAFYARLSVLRELLRAEYSKNIVRDPVLRARAETWAALGRLLPLIADPDEDKPPRWALRGAPLRRLEPPFAVEEALKALSDATLEERVRAALLRGGPMRRVELIRLIEATAPAEAPAEDEPLSADLAPLPVDRRMGVRAALLEGWAQLDADERALVSALALGASYDALVGTSPRLRHKVAVTRAVERVNSVLLAPLMSAEGAAPGTTGLAPGRLLEAALDVLAELLPLGPPSGPGAV